MQHLCISPKSEGFRVYPQMIKVNAHCVVATPHPRSSYAAVSDFYGHGDEDPDWPDHTMALK